MKNKLLQKLSIYSIMIRAIDCDSSNCITKTIYELGGES